MGGNPPSCCLLHYQPGQKTPGYFGVSSQLDKVIEHVPNLVYSARASAYYLAMLMTNSLSCHTSVGPGVSGSQIPSING